MLPYMINTRDIIDISKRYFKSLCLKKAYHNDKFHWSSVYTYADDNIFASLLILSHKTIIKQVNTQQLLIYSYYLDESIHL